MKKIHKILLIYALLTILIYLPNANLINCYSYFSSCLSNTGSIKATEEKDIIDTFLIDNSNPPIIKIKKGANLAYNPVVYFKIQGEISKYILNVNPIKLENEDLYLIHLNINPSFSQILYLLKTPEIQEIQGKVTMSYLNGYITNEANISLNREYILKQYCKHLNIGYNKLNEKAIIDELMINISKEKNWDLLINPSNELVIDETQNKILDIVFPGIKAYHSSLLNTITDYSNIIKSQQETINSLEKRIVNHNYNRHKPSTTTEQAISCN